MTVTAGLPSLVRVEAEEEVTEDVSVAEDTPRKAEDDGDSPGTTPLTVVKLDKEVVVVEDTDPDAGADPDIMAAAASSPLSRSS